MMYHDYCITSFIIKTRKSIELLVVITIVIVIIMIAGWWVIIIVIVICCFQTGSRVLRFPYPISLISIVAFLVCANKS